MVRRSCSKSCRRRALEGVGGATLYGGTVYRPLQVGLQRGSEECRPRVRIGGILKRIPRPGKGGAALREALGGEALGCECSGVAGELKALVR